ncbi:MAG: hypothetical protein ACRDNL_10490 [Spirillospora sp.]
MRSLWQATWLEPDAVRRVSTGPDEPIMTWQTLVEELRGNDRLRVPATGTLPEGVERDDPLPPHPNRRLWPAEQVLSRTLARITTRHES